VFSVSENRTKHKNAEVHGAVGCVASEENRVVWRPVSATGHVLGSSAGDVCLSAARREHVNTHTCSEKEYCDVTCCRNAGVTLPRLVSGVRYVQIP
jgi:hypothetical protein